MTASAPTTDRSLVAARLYARVAKPILASVYPPDVCINAASITSHVFDVLGLKSQPLTVQVDILNPPLVALVGNFQAKHGRQPTDDEWTGMASKLAGGHLVGLGYAESPIPGQPYTELHKWPGHLVTILEGRVLIDLTLDQSSRPNSGIVLKPVVQEVPPAFLMGSGWLPTVHPYGKNAASLAVYKARPFDNTYRSAPAWKLNAIDQRIIDLILEEITRG